MTTRPLRRRLRAAALVAALALLVGGCGDTGGASTTAPTPSPTATTPDRPSKRPAPAAANVTGTIQEGVEPGCTLLDTGSAQLLLLGLRDAPPTAGTRVIVTGRRLTDVLSHCQQGTPFQVTALRTID